MALAPTTAMNIASLRNRLTSPTVRRVLRTQQVLVFVGVLVYALLAALHYPAPFAVMMVCILVVGNVLAPLQTAGERFYSQRPFPWNWIVYLPMLAVSAVVAVLASVLLLTWILPEHVPFRTLFREAAPLGFVVTMAAGIIGYLVRQIQRRLELKNRQLELAVERGSSALLQQEQELRRAREIQQDLLPKTLPQLPGVQLAGAWQPARAVGGDYFDVIRFEDDRLGICIADVAGKGMAAALLMANLQAAFRAFATAEVSPASVCSKLNAFLCSNVATGKFITFFYAVLDPERRTLTYENAGHCPPLLLKRAGRQECLRGQGAVLGILPDWQYQDTIIQLEAGDRLVLFTDGVTEAENGDGAEFGEERLIRAANADSGTPLGAQRKIMEAVAAFCDNNFRDDATLLVASIN